MGPAVHNSTQKQALKNLLEQRFGAVRTEVGFDWLTVPAPSAMTGLVERIHEALGSLRGHAGFASADRRLYCDLFVPTHRLLIEYDERQHFTLARAAALRLYPPELRVCFEKADWIAACEVIRANDPTPPFRDEQRALYDSLRDVRAAEKGYTLIRLRDGEVDWTSPEAGPCLDELLRRHGVASADEEVTMTTEADHQIVVSYLRQKNWYWEEMVKDLLGHDDSRIINTVGDRVRKAWKDRYRLGQFDDAEMDRLVSFIRLQAAALGPLSGQARSRPPDPSTTQPALHRLHAEGEIKKVALVSHNYNHADADGLWDYSRYSGPILRACNEQRCDTVLFALYTWDSRSTATKSVETLFGKLNHVQRIVMECGDFSAHSDDPSYKDLWVEVWLRAEPQPFIMRQRFAAAQEGDRTQFIRELPFRQVGNALVVICGESQIVSEKRVGGFTDDYGFLPRLDDLAVRVIFNPVHDFMALSHGIDVCKKRQHYSQNGRTVISVWNAGKAKGAAVAPWTVYRDGDDRTADVVEISSPIDARPDIRIGIVSV